MESKFRAKIPTASKIPGLERQVRVTITMKIADRNILKAAASYSNSSLAELLADIAQQFRTQFLQLRQSSSTRKGGR